MASTPTIHRSEPRVAATATPGRGGEPGGQPLVAALRPAWVDVDLDALERNLARMLATVRPARVLAVLKADAYGHGAPRVARLLEGAGVDWAGVALVEEGAELRRAGVGLPILVLGTAQPSQLPLFRRYRLVPTVSSLDQLALWRQYAAGEGGGGDAPRRPQPLHLKVDTGMNRLGVAMNEVAAALAAVRASPGLRLAGLISHLAEADDPGSGANSRQEERFAEVLGLLNAEERRRVAVHLANSAGALHRSASRHDLVRLGLSLYGLDPAAGREGAPDDGAGAGDDLEPVMAITSRIVQLRAVEPGAAVGYGGRWTAARPSRIAVVPVGYADGYAWRLGREGGAVALVRGRRVPVAGAVSMDMLTLDVTDVGEGMDTAGAAAIGDEVTLLGRQGGERLTAWELAGAAGTIPYELLCLLGLRLPRRYFRHGRLEAVTSRFSEGPA